MIQPIIRVDNKELILNQTFLIEEKSKSLDIAIPFIDKKANNLVRNLQIKFIFEREWIKRIESKSETNFENGILKISTTLPRNAKTYSKEPTTFEINNSKFSIFTEIDKIRELYKMTVSIYKEDK